MVTTQIKNQTKQIVGASYNTMSNLSGYDSESVGFESVTSKPRSEKTCSTQTSEFAESGMGCQTELSCDRGCTATPQDLNAQDHILHEYPPPGLNEFLRKVVPSMLEQLDQKEKDQSSSSSESDEEDVLTAKLFQEINTADSPSIGAGDHAAATVLDLSFSCGGNSLAVAVGSAQHEQWCQHDGLVRVYTARRLENGKFVHSLDITEKNCITVVRYHPNVAALLAYGTISGEVVLCCMRSISSSVEENVQLTSPSGCHGSRRVSHLMWADSALANTYLTMQILNTGKRRSASDQVLVSSGSDGTMNVWQVNSNLKVFESIVCYKINGSRQMAAPDISCFDFIKTFPLRSWDEKGTDDVFVVGTKCGELFVCSLKSEAAVGTAADPVRETLEAHRASVLSVAFSAQRPGLLASVSADAELRLYQVDQPSPLRIICLDVAATCVAWLPNNPSGLACGARGGQLAVCDAARGRVLPVGLSGEAVCLTALPGTPRIAAGDSRGTVRVWDVPTRRLRLAPEDLVL